MQDSRVSVYLYHCCSIGSHSAASETLTKDLVTDLPRPSPHPIITLSYELSVEEAVENMDLKGNEAKMTTGHRHGTLR